MPDDLTPFERAISQARPAANDADAVRAAYEAGRRDGLASASRSATVWRVAAGLLLVATTGLSVARLADSESTSVVEANQPSVETAPAPEPAEHRPEFTVSPRRFSPLRPQSVAVLRRQLDDNLMLDPVAAPRRGSGSLPDLDRVPRLGDSL